MTETGDIAYYYDYSDLYLSFFFVVPEMIERVLEDVLCHYSAEHIAS